MGKQSRHKQRLREQYFQAGSAACTRVFSLAPDSYVCPLCGLVCGRQHLLNRTLTLEHVPPAAMGGRALCLTCAACNNAAGHSSDVALSEFRKLQALTGALTRNESLAKTPVTLVADGVSLNASLLASSAGVRIIVKESRNDPDLTRKYFESRPAGGGSFDFKLTGKFNFSPRKILAAQLRAAYLAAFCMFELGPLFDIGGLASSSAAGGIQTQWAPHTPDFGAIIASPVALGGVMYTGVVTTALALWVESIAFARVPVTDASIILTTEPLFAAALGAISLGETFGTSDYVGATLIVGACVLAALMDNPGDEECVVEEDAACEPPRKWPFWGF